jgi:hypothetical protein
MKTPQSFWLGYLLMLSLFACQEKEATTATVIPQKLEAVQELGKNMVWSRLQSLQQSPEDSCFYTFDYNAAKLLKISPDFQTSQTIADKGQGPGELAFPYALACFQGKIFATEGAKGSMQIYQNGQYLSSFKLPYEVGNAQQRLPVDVKGHIYLPTPNGKRPITVVDSTGKVLRDLGEFWKNEDLRKQINRNNRLLCLVSSRNLLVAVCINIPQIEIYDLKSDKLLKVIDLSEMTFLQKRLEHIAQESKKNGDAANSAYIIAEDAVSDGQKLYVLFSNNYIGDSGKV